MKLDYCKGFYCNDSTSHDDCFSDFRNKRCVLCDEGLISDSKSSSQQQKLWHRRVELWLICMSEELSDGLNSVWLCSCPSVCFTHSQIFPSKIFVSPWVAFQRKVTTRERGGEWWKVQHAVILVQRWATPSIHSTLFHKHFQTESGRRLIQQPCRFTVQR